MAALFDREHEPPEPSESDVAYDLVKTVISAVPGAALVFDHVFGSPFQRRQQEWMEGVAGDLRRLERERGITLETMRDNPAFIDAAFSAYQAFIKTSDEQKRAA